MAEQGRTVKRRLPQPADPTQRRCADCADVKDVSDFPRSGAGWGSYCKPCHNARGRQTVAKLGGARHYHLKRRYGIGSDDVEAMIEAQGGLCAICGEAPPAHVDHDHGTGAVRGILCFNCNGGLGQFRDRVDILRNAIEYLEGRDVG
jgi:hypothetical protein